MVSRPLDAWCPACRERVAFDDQGRCLWCDEQTGGGARVPPTIGQRSHAGKPYLMDEATILEARVLYASGLSLRAVARELHPRTAYTSVASLRVALETQFALRGWELRTQRAATVAASLRHGRARRDGDRRAYKAWLRAQRLRPCAGVRTSYPRRGAPCRRPALRESDYCIAHDPARAAEREAQLRMMRARVGKAA